VRLNDSYVMRWKELNSILVIVVIGLFLLIFPTLQDVFGFLGYFLLILITGVSILSTCKASFDDALIFLTVSLAIGIVVNYLVFYGMALLSLPTYLSPFVGGIFGALVCITQPKNIGKKLRLWPILKQKHFWILALLLVGSLLLLSDRVVYLNDGVMVHDSIHPLYESSISNSLDNPWQLKDLSYQGKELKYHMGYPILLHQLTTTFGVDEFNLIYVLFPAFLSLLALLLLNTLALKVTKHPLFFTVLIAFSTLSLPLSRGIKVFDHFFGTSIPFTLFDPFFFFKSLTSMNSTGVGILLLLALLAVILLKRNYLVEILLLTGIAMTKVTFFVPLAFGYTAFLLWQFSKEKKFFQLIRQGILLLPGTVYFLFFINGAHQQNLWVLFLGSLNLQTTTISSLGLNTLLSLVASITLFVGVGWLYLWLTRKEKKSENHQLLLFLIGASFFLGLFLVEVTEANNGQFMIPGSIFLGFLSYSYFLNSPKKKFFVTFLSIFLIINAMTFLGISYILPTTKIPDTIGENNPLAEVKLAFFSELPLPQQGLTPNCYYNQDLIDGYQFLATQPDGTFVFPVLLQDCETYQSDEWKTRSGFVRTALSGKQTLVENYKYKSIIAQSDYCPRVFENIFFYSLLTGTENEIPLLKERFIPGQATSYEDLSYYTYFSKFSDENYYTYGQSFFVCMQENLDSKKVEDPLLFMKEYLSEQEITYIVFEQGQQPLKKYVEELGLHLIYSSEEVKIYSREPSLFHNVYKAISG
jgi:hypothetical protein